MILHFTNLKHLDLSISSFRKYKHNRVLTLPFKRLEILKLSFSEANYRLKNINIQSNKLHTIDIHKFNILKMNTENLKHVNISHAILQHINFPNVKTLTLHNVFCNDTSNKSIDMKHLTHLNYHTFKCDNRIHICSPILEKIVGNDDIESDLSKYCHDTRVWMDSIKNVRCKVKSSDLYIKYGNENGVLTMSVDYYDGMMNNIEINYNNCDHFTLNTDFIVREQLYKCRNVKRLTCKAKICDGLDTLRYFKNMQYCKLEIS